MDLPSDDFFNQIFSIEKIEDEKKYEFEVIQNGKEIIVKVIRNEEQEIRT